MKNPKVSRRKARETALQVLYCNAFSDSEIMRSVAGIQHVKTSEDLNQILQQLNDLRNATDAIFRAVDGALESMQSLLKEGGRAALKPTKEQLLPAVLHLTRTRREALSTLRETSQRINNVDPLFDDKSFTMRLIQSVNRHEDAIDTAIKRSLTGWNMNRLTAEVRSILQLGTAELLFFDDVPPAAIIDQYIEISKEFSDDDGQKLVNGVLDRIRRDNPRENKE